MKKILIAGYPELTRNYRDAFSRLGADVTVSLDLSISDFDALVLPGGDDIHPRAFHDASGSSEVRRVLSDTFPAPSSSESQPEIPPVLVPSPSPVRSSTLLDPDLDLKQFRILDSFVRSGRPVLGICRGLQLLNVYFGGTLWIDLPTSSVHRYREASGDQVHLTQAAPESILAQLYGTQFPINSAHHQGICRPGDGLRIIQTSMDGAAEAVVHKSLPIWGVQWHPERMCFDRRREDTVDGSRILDAFIQKVSDR